MVVVLHKFGQYMLSNKCIFYVDHMSLIYLVNKTYVFRWITRWLLPFLEYEFFIIYKLRRTHVMVDALSRLLDTKELVGVSSQTINVYIIYHATYMDQGSIRLLTKGKFSNNFTTTQKFKKLLKE